MTEIPTSVVIVSRSRPDALQRCITGIEQLYYSAFELVVVADPAGCEAVRAMGLASTIKLVPFDASNISAARNLGIAAAAGDVVAFIDDDAVPEPMWLAHLIPPFADPELQSAGGFVRGRNGISFQNKGRSVNRTGQHSPLTVAPGGQVFANTPELTIKTEGTNCAFRSSTLRSLGGFDPNFCFYLDETDVNLRLARMGGKAALVPEAEVHHGFLPSAYRRKSRVPTDLFEIGASQAYFLRNHADPSEIAEAERSFVTEQRRRLLRHMVAGTCEPAEVNRLLLGLKQGMAEGATRRPSTAHPISARSSEFQPFRGRVAFKTADVLLGRPVAKRALMARSQQLLSEGTRVSLFLFDATARFHHVAFEDGVWIQTGGLFGKSKRNDPMIRKWRRPDRLMREKLRVAVARNL